MIRTNVSLAPLTTFGLGGPARSFATAHSVPALEATLTQAGDDPIFLLGGGSNLLVHDDGVPGLVLACRIDGVSYEESADGTLVRAGAGEDWDRLVSACVEKGLAGIECLSGIPGTVGAAPVQNIGAYGQSIADVLCSVQAFDRENGKTISLSADECGLGYRRSVFQERPLIVTGVEMLLRPGGAPHLAYQDLRHRFENASPTLRQVRRAVLDIRASKGALAMDGYPRLRSAGSFFKNPVIGQTLLDDLRGTLEHGDASRRWFWPQADGRVKVAAGRLIEGAGFPRGFRDGSVGNSPHHSLTLVAYDGATAADIVGLARRIQETVLKRFKVLLEAEPRLWGWSEYPLLAARS